MLSPDEVYGVLNTVMDPEVPVISVVELGIVRDVVIHNEAVTITITKKPGENAVEVAR